MRDLRQMYLLVVAMLLVALSAFASDDNKFPVQFTVKAASSDADGCYMSLVDKGMEYSVYSGTGLHGCPVFRPGSTLTGQFRDDQHSIQVPYKDKKGKDKVQNYTVRMKTLLPD